MPTPFIRGAFWLFAFLTLYLAGAPIDDTYWDRAEDAMAFFMLSFLLDEGWPQIKLWKKCAMLLVFGVIIEAAQTLIPGRQPGPADVVANAAAIGFYLLVRPLLLRLLHV